MSRRVPSRSTEIERLRRRLTKVRNAWGDRAVVPPEAERLEQRIADKRISEASMRFRIEAATEVLADLRRAQRALEAEIEGYERGLEAILRARLEEAEGWAAPMWSPIPVHGYRAWWVTAKGLQGATRFVWDTPRLTAMCGPFDGTDDGDVPHTDGRCGAPPCGIYVLKDPGIMVRMAASTGDEESPVVIGLTALSGKVVEHDEGYRAQHAEVTAAVVIAGDRVICGDSPNWIAHLFGNPAAAIGAVPALPDGPDRYVAAIDYLADRRTREEQRWTSASRSE
jgi:hypothetical protein